MHSVTDWAATEEREREAGGRREMETERERQRDCKEKETETDRARTDKVCRGTAETHSVYCKWCKNRVSVTGKAI